MDAYEDYDDPTVDMPGVPDGPSQAPADYDDATMADVDLDDATDIENGEPIPDPVEDGKTYDLELVDGGFWESPRAKTPAIKLKFLVYGGSAATETIEETIWLPNLKKDSSGVPKDDPAKAAGKVKRGYRALKAMGMDVRGRTSAKPHRKGKSMSLVEGADLLVKTVKRARNPDGSPGVIFTCVAKIDDFGATPKMRTLKVKSPKGWQVPR